MCISMATAAITRRMSVHQVKLMKTRVVGMGNRVCVLGI